MISGDVMTLRTRFVTEWQNGVATVFDNQPNEQLSDDQPFVRFSVRPGVETRASFSSDVQLGRVIVSVFVPRQQGAKPAYDLADEAAAIFRQWRSPDYQLHCTSPEISTDDSDPQWFRVDVNTPWRSYRA